MNTLTILTQKYVSPFTVTWMIGGQQYTTTYTNRNQSLLVNVIKLIRLHQVVISDLPKILSTFRSRANVKDHPDFSVVEQKTTTSGLICGLTLDLENDRYQVGYRFTETESYWITHDLRGNKVGDKVDIKE